MIDNYIKTPSFSAAQLQDFFKPASWILKFDFINHLVLFNNVMMAVIDEEGGGKTTFCKLLQNHLNSQIKVIYFSGLNPSLGENAFLSEMSDIMHKPLNTLESLVESINQLETHYLLVIDNAERLSMDIMVSLIQAIRLQKGTAFFHVCLAGDKGLAKTLSAMERHDEFKDFIHAFEPGTLKLNEVKTYVRRKLMSASDGMRHVVADDARIEEFYKLTSGHMSRINKNFDFFKSKQKPSYKKIAAAGIVFMAAGSAYLFSHYQSNFLDTIHRTISEQAKQDQPDQANIKMANLPADNAYATQMVLSLGQGQTERFGAKEHDSTSGSIKINAQAASLSGPLLQTNELVQIVAVTKGRQIAVKSLVIRGPEKQVHKPMLSAVTAKSHALIKKHMASNLERKASKMHVALRDRREVILHGAATGRVMQHARQYNGYTIQLVASKKREDIERFMMEHRLQHAVAMKISKREGERWYVLTYGRYLSAIQAALAIKTLPKKVASTSPWVRKERELMIVG